MPAHRNPTPQSSRSLQRMEAGFWVEHSRLFRNADTESARYPNAAGCRNPRSAHKIRGDEPGALDPSDKLALFHENFLPETASTSQQSRHTPGKMLPNQPNKLQLFPPCQIMPYPTRQLPRNNLPLYLPRSHETAWRGTIKLHRVSLTLTRWRKWNLLSGCGSGFNRATTFSKKSPILQEINQPGNGARNRVTAVMGRSSCGEIG